MSKQLNTVNTPTFYNQCRLIAPNIVVKRRREREIGTAMEIRDFRPMHLDISPKRYNIRVSMLVIYQVMQRSAELMTEAKRVT